MTVNYHPTSPSPSSSSNSSSSSAIVATSMMAGAAIAGAAFYVASRGGASPSVTSNHTAAAANTMLLSSYQTMLRELEQSLRQNIQRDVAKEVQHGLAQTTTHFQKSLQSQELVLQKSLLPMATARSVMDGIHRDVGEIKNIFHSPKARGNLGEFLLESLVQDAMPAELYDFQYTLSNKKRVDCILHLGAPIGKLPVDSKFPLDSFLLQHQQGEPNGKPNTSHKARIEQALTKHITDIATKYIIPGETADFAILFLPSASVYLRIVEDHADILNLALQKRVYLACPLTLMPLLAVLHRGARGVEWQEQTQEMMNYHQKQTDDIDRLLKRYEEVVKANDKTTKLLEKMRISIGKIQQRKREWDVVYQFDPVTDSQPITKRETAVSPRTNVDVATMEGGTHTSSANKSHSPNDESPAHPDPVSSQKNHVSIASLDATNDLSGSVVKSGQRVRLNGSA